jgi:hypothetical protein
MNKLTLPALFSVVLMLAGCSSDSSSPGPQSVAPSQLDWSPCDPLVACGGDLIGTWQLEDICVNEAARAEVADSLEYCSAATTSVTASLTGSMRFDASGQLRVLVDRNIAVDSSVPDTCLTALGGCPQVQAELSLMKGYSDVKCDQAEGGCACRYSYSSPRRTESTYQAQGTRYTETSPLDGKTTVSEYCVVGDALRLYDESGGYALRRVQSP